MKHVLGICVNPQAEWERIRVEGGSIFEHYLKFVIPIALVAPVAWYVGSTRIGWAFGERVIRLTTESAFEIMALFYLAILAGVGLLGYMVHWMSETYEAHTSTPARGFAVAAYTCTPLFLIGFTGFYPLLWLDILLGCAAAAYAVYLLYIGVPIVMQVPRERGFLFASAMVAVGLVMCAALLGATVILWELGAMPVFVE